MSAQGLIVSRQGPRLRLRFRAPALHADPQGCRAPRADRVRAACRAQPGAGRDLAVAADGTIILRRHGHRIVSARNGAEALALLALDPDIRLVIADIVMPGMTGFELGAQIRAAYPAIRILYTSGYVAASVDSTALGQGMDFLEKPYRPDQLIDRINAMLAAG